MHLYASKREGGRERMGETKMMSQACLYLEGLEVRHHRLTFSKHQQLLLNLMRLFLFRLISFTHSQTCNWVNNGLGEICCYF